jgi:hypothetical protein
MWVDPDDQPDAVDKAAQKEQHAEQYQQDQPGRYPW